MVFEAKLTQTQKLSQQLVMTPQLRQAIKILQVSRAELEQIVDQEMAENPTLEEGIEDAEEAEEPPARTAEGVDAGANGSSEWGEAVSLRETTPEVEPDKPLDNVDWKEYLDNYANDWHGASATPADYDDDRRTSLENRLTRAQSLTDYVIEQLRLLLLDATEAEIATRLVGNLDEAGYLTVAIEDVAFETGRDFDAVEAVLRKIQALDPPGLGARDLRECLLLQLESAGEGRSLAARIVRDHLDLLEAKRYGRIAKLLGVEAAEVAEAARRIASLEPKPGRNFGGADARYITPDVYVHRVGDEWVVTVNDDGLPRLRVSSYYRRILREKGAGEAKRYIQEKMRSATWLIRSIQQRQRTLYLVTSSIVKFQREFLEKGISHLRPLILRDVAMDIGMHESTVSRATANKYVHTPQGIFELKFFFTSSVRSGDGDEVSAESVKERIREIIAAEDPSRPLSDQSIARLLKREKIVIARRTVAKYREAMGILSSSKRRQVRAGGEASGCRST